MAIKKAYTAKAVSKGGRGGGTAKTDDGMLDLVIAGPKELGGTGQGTNPDQLFAVGYSSCYLGSMKYANAKQKKALPWSPDSTVTTYVSFGPRSDKKGFGIEVRHEVHLPGLTKAQAAAIAKKGHVVCAYSQAIRRNVKVTTKII